MKRFELLQRIGKIGALFVRHGGGHDVCMQPRTNKEAAVPRHDRINDYTAKSILKKLS
jgi:hypothetical protein